MMFGFRRSAPPRASAPDPAIIVVTAVFSAVRRSMCCLPSEGQLQCQLQPPRIARRDDLPKPGIGLLARGIELGGGIQRRELGVVKRVVGLQAELRLETLLDLDVLEQRRVPEIDRKSTRLNSSHL